jgi:hypothetical protein
LEAFVSIKSKWLKALMMVMLAVTSFGGPMNPREIEDLMRIMNQTQIEYTIPDKDKNGEPM